MKNTNNITEMNKKLLEEYEINHIPEHWSYIGELDRTPKGYKWISNNKCWLSDEYKRALISDELCDKNKDYLTSNGFFTKDLNPGDITFIRNEEGNYVKTTVLGLGDDITIDGVSVANVPYVDYYDGCENNLKNYIFDKFSKKYIKKYRIMRTLEGKEILLCVRYSLEESINDLTHIFTREWIKNPEIKNPANYVIIEEINDFYKGFKYYIDKAGNIVRKEVA